MDLRFRQLLAPEDWEALPPEVQARFSHTAPQVIYDGVVEYTRLSPMGRALAQILRLIGAPLPLCAHETARPAQVIVDETPAGHRWTREYADGRGRVQRIVSEKRFVSRGGLEEMITPWLGMALKVDCGGNPQEGLFFRGHRFNLHIAGRRIALPQWLCPGRLCVRHIPLSSTHFAFTLTITHPWFGTLVDQCGVFSEAQSEQPITPSKAHFLSNKAALS